MNAAVKKKTVEAGPFRNTISEGLHACLHICKADLKALLLIGGKSEAYFLYLHNNDES